LTLRNYFGICGVDDEYIYIIGGYNFHNGTLKKCEKINVKTKKVSLIKNLNYASSHCCVTNFNNTHICKFGGINKNYDSLLINNDEY